MRGNLEGTHSTAKDGQSTRNNLRIAQTDIELRALRDSEGGGDSAGMQV